MAIEQRAAAFFFDLRSAKDVIEAPSFRLTSAFAFRAKHLFFSAFKVLFSQFHRLPSLNYDANQTRTQGHRLAGDSLASSDCSLQSPFAPGFSIRPWVALLSPLRPLKAC